MAPAQQVKWTGGYNIELAISDFFFSFNTSLLRAYSKEKKKKAKVK